MSALLPKATKSFTDGQLFAPHRTSTLAADPDSHGGMELTFRRIIVYPDGHQHIEGKTPKQLPPPDDTNDIK